ncbi:hypothetical protein [Gilvimarinus algae]|uniref:Uncharacterized protein n=1 Tax=Gilvimarinus algae TaxID=3058037 RepID=A0ABT8TBK8_9GAMM|nr:hypothetical protein [Gilvimarinus sp. SDUM040014]MDO3381408.1 hypothetical protein [Gilvimarinus sp. SDUM040014]
MKSLGVILAGMVVCWFLTDVRSQNGFFNLFMPLCVLLFVIAFLFWLVFALAERRSGNTSRSALDVFDHQDLGGSDGGGD